MEASIYSNLPDDVLSYLHSQHTAHYGKALFDNTRPLQERKLVNLIQKSVRPDKQQEEWFSVRECIKEILIRKATEIAMLIYLVMQKTQDFGLHGEYRITTSFCRTLLSIPDDSHIDEWDHLYPFRRLIHECDIRHGSKPAEEYLEIVKNYSLDILGQKFPISSTDMFIQLYELLGCDWLFWTSSSLPYGARFILGVLDKRKIENNEVWLMKEEYIRSPQFCLNVAAEIFRDTTVIRHEALNVIFFNKWQSFFEEKHQTKNGRYSLFQPHSAIRDGFIYKALSLFGASSTEDVLKMKDSFILDIMLSVTWHELGHHVSYTDWNLETYNFHYTITNNNHCGSVIMEALADLAPRKGDKQGSFSYFVELSQQDLLRATRAHYAYVSDAWFIEDDGDEEFMCLYSDVLVSLALHFVRKDGSVDFKRIAEEQAAIYSFFQERFKNLAESLIAVIREAEYDFTIQKISFCELEEKELKMQRENGKPTLSMKELRDTDYYWENMTGYFEKFSKDGWKKYNAIINKEDQLLEQEVVKIVTKNSQKKAHSLRAYIFERVIDIGLIILPSKKEVVASLKSISKKSRHSITVKSLPGRRWYK